MKPFFSRAVKWLWTVELLVSPSAAPISRTDGGYPRCCMLFITYPRISRCRFVSPFPTFRPPRPRLDHRDRDYSTERSSTQTGVRHSGANFMCLYLQQRPAVDNEHLSGKKLV